MIVANSFYMKAEPLAGTTIDDACAQAVELADRIGVGIEFDFNGVTCCAKPGGSAAVLSRNWSTAMNSKSSVKLAFSH